MLCIISAAPSCRSTKYLLPAAKGLYFSNNIQHISNNIVKRMQAITHYDQFRGVHLRIEGDWLAVGPSAVRNKTVTLMHDVFRADEFVSVAYI